jgi:hypothetical protein
MNTFNDPELKLIARLHQAAPQAVLRINTACPLHSYCTPLPVFRVYKIDEATFEAEWNDVHRPGPKQVFRFAEAV